MMSVLAVPNRFLGEWLRAGPFERLDNMSLDLRFKLRGERQVGDDLVIVAIDEKSLAEIGRWPWSRNVQAQLVERISLGHPRVIALDILLPEAERADSNRTIQTLLRMLESAGIDSDAVRTQMRLALASADPDRRLITSFRSAGNVVLSFALEVPGTRSTSLSEDNSRLALDEAFLKKSRFMLIRQVKSGEELSPYRATGIHRPLAGFTDAAIGLGHVYSIPDRDGVTRLEYLALQYGDDIYPSFALEIARVALGIPREHMAFIQGSGVQLGDRLIPTDQKARMLINYVGRERSFPYLSATDVIHQRIPPVAFRNKIVLVGTTALGTYDQKASPFSANVPGVEKNATVVENILHSQFVRKTLWAEPVTLGGILLMGLGLGVVIPRLRALPGAYLAFFLLVGYLTLAQYLFVRGGLWIDLVYPVLTLLLTFVSITVLRLMTEEKQAKEIRAMFSSYVSPVIVEELIKDPSKAAVGGQRKELTILFADLVGFTSFSEQHTPEEVVGQLNEYLRAMTDVVFHWHGTLDKFVGDAIVAFWGAPLDQPDHVELGLKCALHMRRRLTELQDKWRTEGKTPFNHGIGINTGQAIVGNIGAEGKKIEYTVIGDQVNLAARVQELTREYGYSILLTEQTARHLMELIHTEERIDNRGHLGHVSVRRLGSVRVRGKSQPVGVYALESLARGERSRVVGHSSPEVMTQLS